MLQLIDESISSDSQMLVRVNNRRHDRLAGQIDMSGAGRNIDLSFSSDGSEPPVCDDKGGVGDRSIAAAGDEPRTFEYRHGCATLSANRIRLRQNEQD